MPATRGSKPASSSRPRDAGGVRLVYDFLREQILSKSLVTGDRLPPERDLAAQLGVSRPVLREALRALAMIGAVEIRHGAGTVLRRPDAAALGDFFSFAMLQDAPVAEDVMQARIAVECQAARLACARATATDFTTLRAAVEAIEGTVGEVEAGARADHAFHSALVQAGHSPVLAALYATLTEPLYRTHVFRRGTTPSTDEFKAYVIDDHKRILTALVERNVERLDAVLRRHFVIGDEFREQAIQREILSMWSA